MAASGFNFSLRTSKLSNVHFDHNAYTHMRVYLAAQITSESMLRLIDDYAKDKIDEYRLFQAIVLALDRLIDIMNAKYENGAVIKGCVVIDSPTHHHLDELSSIAALFAEWKKNSKEPSHFITETSYQDMLWLCFGTVGIACQCLLKTAVVALINPVMGVTSVSIILETFG